MKKVFLLIFCGFLFNISASSAEVFSIVDVNHYQPKGKNPAEAVAPDLPDPNDQEAVRNFFKERIEHAAVTKEDPDDDYTTPSSINIVHTPEYYKAQEEQKKPLFQKMYEEALRFVREKEDIENGGSAAENIDEQEAAQTATRFFTVNTPQRPRVEDEYADESNIETVAFSLPSGRRMLAPALGHIPYFLSYIDIQANGYLKVEETIIVVADGRKFLKPLQRIFSKYAYDDKGRAQRIEMILGEVLVNNQSVPYTIEEVGNNIVIKPKYKQTLESGVYTYTFNYLVNHHLQPSYDNMVMNWNLIGQPLNAFITSANAIVTLPTGQTFKNLQSIIGRKGQYTNRRSNIIPMAPNVVAISNFTPLLNGENMNIVAIADRSAFLPNFNSSFNNFMFNWGAVVYAILGFLAVLAAYLLSFMHLKHEKKTSKYKPFYNAALIRQILVGKYDYIAFTSQVLDLYRKQVIDITDENGRLFLTRQHVNNKNLNKAEKKAIKCLFSKKNNNMEINTNGSKILKKICHIFKKYNLQQMRKINLLHNIVYIIFSVAMLLLTEFFIAFLNLNFMQTFIVLLLCSSLYAFYIWILRHKFKRWYVNIPVKILTLVAIFAVWVCCSLYAGGTPSALILLTVVTIFVFTEVFNKHNNFMSDAIKSISAYREYLIANAETINLGRDFLNHQSSIFALDIAEYFPQNVTNQAFYKLDIAEDLHRALVGLI